MMRMRDDYVKKSNYVQRQLLAQQLSVRQSIENGQTDSERYNDSKTLHFAEECMKWHDSLYKLIYFTNAHTFVAISSPFYVFPLTNST